MNGGIGGAGFWVGAAAAAFAVCAAQAAEWPCFRGPQRNGVTAESFAWGGLGAAGPRPLWRASVGTGFSGFAVAGGRAVTLGHADGEDSVWCLDAASGAVLWRHRYACEAQPLSYEGGPGATPAIAEGRVYTFSKGGDLHCLALDDGRVLWSRRFPPWPWREGDWKNTWRYAGSPWVADGRLYLSLGEAGAAFGAADGVPVWQSEPGHPGYASPVPFAGAEGPALVFFAARGAVGVEAATGRRLWEVPWRTEWDYNAADPVYAGGRLFLSSGNNAGCAQYEVGAGQPRERWRNAHLRTPMGSVVLWQGYLYGFNDADLCCVAWESGERAWSDRSLRRGSVLVAGGDLVALSEDGTLAAGPASSEGFRPVWRGKVLGGRCWTAPALADGRLYLRNARGEAVCLDLRAASAR